MRLDDDFFVSKVPHLSNFSRTETAFQYNGPMIWNSLPQEIRSVPDIETFKKKLKYYYFNFSFTEISGTT